MVYGVNGAPPPPPPATKVCLPGFSSQPSSSHEKVAEMVNVKVPFAYLQVLISALRVRYLQLNAAVLSFIGMRKVSESENFHRLPATQIIELRRMPLLGEFHQVFFFLFLSGRRRPASGSFTVARFMQDGFSCVGGVRLQGPLMIADMIANKYF